MTQFYRIARRAPSIAFVFLERPAMFTASKPLYPRGYRVGRSFLLRSSVTSPNSKTTSYLTNLTSLRGVAALLTVIFHVDLMLGDSAGGLLRITHSGIINRLYLMVDFFFILSGFIMVHVYGTGFSRGVTGSTFKRFTLARFARVYPLHFATLIYAIVLFAVAAILGLPTLPVMQVENSGYSIVTNLLLLQSMNLHHWFTWVHASWSISTEWWMYMLFPFLVVPFSQLSGRGRAVVAALAFAGYVGIMYFVIPIVSVPASMPFLKVNPADLSINVAYQYGILRCFCGFVLGMAVYGAYARQWGRTWLANGYTLLGLVGCEALCLHLSAPDAITVMCDPLILLSAAYGSPRANTVLGSRIMRTIGDWSFSIYLTHQPLLFTYYEVQAWLARGQPVVVSSAPPTGMLYGWGVAAVVIGAALVVSAGSYHLVEVPARRRINQWAGRAA